VVKELQRVVKRDDAAQWASCVDNTLVCEVVGDSGKKL
jgi:hypothetical protein